MNAGSVVGGLLRRREAGIFLALVALSVLIAIVQPDFRRGDNLYRVSRQIAYIAIVALGVFFVILTSGIDLSIGSTVSFSGVICGLLMVEAGLPAAAAVVGGLMAGAVIGAVNGALVSYVGIAPFITTLGMMGIVRGAVLVITGGNTVEHIPESFINAGVSVWGMSTVVGVLAVVAVLSHVVLTYTAFGRRVYAVGGNEAATALSGINTRRVKLMAYMVSGVLCSMTGVLYIARFRGAQANSGLGIEMDAIAAAVIGGTSLMGGEGTVAGVLIGATIMGVIRNGLDLVDVSPYCKELIIGTIIVLAAILDIVRSRRR